MMKLTDNSQSSSMASNNYQKNPHLSTLNWGNLFNE